MLETTADMKAQLPDVQIVFGGKLYNARVAGRENGFATVWFRVGSDLVEYEYSWQAILHSVQNDKPLTV